MLHHKGSSAPIQMYRQAENPMTSLLIQGVGTVSDAVTRTNGLNKALINRKSQWSEIGLVYEFFSPCYRGGLKVAVHLSVKHSFVNSFNIQVLLCSIYNN